MTHPIEIGIKPTTSGERVAMTSAVAQIVPDMDPKLGGEIALAVLGAFYRKRFGEAPGSVGVNGPRTAIRFYDAATKSYRWAVHNSPMSAQQQTTMCDTLPGVPLDWVIHEKDWRHLI